jgi:N4-gp56 family major capsid protein
MAQTTRADVAAQIPQLWSTELFAEAENKTFFGRFEGPEGSGMPIIRKDDLTKAAGDTIKTDLVMALKGVGVTADTTSLAGNEEALDFRQLALTVGPLSHAVRWTELTEQLINHDMRSTAKNQLAKWLAGVLDSAKWNALTAGTLPAVNKWYAGDATSVGTVGTADTLTLNDISEMKAYAQAELKVEPLRMENGEEYFGLVVHPYANLALKKDTAYQQAQRDAGVVGDTNRLFTGATFLWDGVIGYVSNRVPTANDGADPDGTGVLGPISVARNVFFGSQAMACGYAQYPDWREEFFDYGRSAGVATTMIKGEKVNVFDFSAAKDGTGQRAIGSLIYYSAAAAPAA